VTVTCAVAGTDGARHRVHRQGHRPRQRPRRHRSGRIFPRVDDFDAEYTQIRSVGVGFVSEPRDQLYGRVAIFEDVAGNRWDLRGPATRPRTTSLVAASRQVDRRDHPASSSATSPREAFKHLCVDPQEDPAEAGSAVPGREPGSTIASQPRKQRRQESVVRYQRCRRFPLTDPSQPRRQVS